MSKEQKTARMRLLSRVAAIQRKIQASADEDLKAWADRLDADEASAKLKSETDSAKAQEADTVVKSTGVSVDTGVDQNAKANANWPMGFSGSMKAASSMVMLARRDAKTAARMLAMARKMRADDADDMDLDDEECVGCTAAKKMVKMAMKHTKSASSMMKLARKLARTADEVGIEDDAPDADAELTASSREKVATRLIALAKTMVADDDDDDDCSASKSAGEVPPQFKENMEKMKDKAKDKDEGKDKDASSKVAEALVQLAKSLGADDEDDDSSK